MGTIREQAIRQALSDARKFAARATAAAENLDDDIEEDRITLSDLKDEVTRLPQVSQPEIEASGPGGLKLRVVVPTGWQLVTLGGLIIVAVLLFFLAKTLK